MKSIKNLFILTIGLAVMSCSQPNNEANSTEEKKEARDFYLIKTYFFDTEEQVAMTDQFLADAYLPGLKRMGINNIGVFKSRVTEEDTVRKIFVLVPLTSLDQVLSLEESLWADPTFQQNGSAYLNADAGAAPYQRIQSVVLRSFEHMPVMAVPSFETPRTDRIYELRSYESPTEQYYWKKVDMFNAGGEIDLFTKLGFNAVFYGEVISGPNMPNLMYMTTHADTTARAANWKSFVDSPEWKEMSGLEKYANTVSHIDVYLLYPAEYSDY
jgi:hypothetical protein